jgi:hypothetical protein
LPPAGEELGYRLPFGEQVAFYVPAAAPTPQRIWVAFCGNGSLALGWTTILRDYPTATDAFLLVDYPGYGKSAGYATVESMRFSADAATRPWQSGSGWMRKKSRRDFARSDTR